MNIVITGGTGSIASRFVELFHDAPEVTKIVLLSRSRVGQHPKYNNVSYASWNPEQLQVDLEIVKNADAIINLAGAGIADKRWTEDYKREIIDSRRDATKTIVQAMNHLEQPKTLVSASAIGCYTPDTDKAQTESMPFAKRYIAEVTRIWEEEAHKLDTARHRLFIPRIGVVLSKKGGALEPLTKTVKMYVGAPIGTGKQLMPWIHEDDLCRILFWGMVNPAKSDTYNAVAPNSVSNAEMMKGIGVAMGKPILPIPVPSFIIKLMLGEFSNQVLQGYNVSCKKIQDAGFTFQYPTLAGALASLDLRNK